MATIAGVDVAAAVLGALQGQLVPGTLTRIEQMPRMDADLTLDRTREREYPFQGLLDQRMAKQRPGTITGTVASSVLILANSLDAGRLRPRAGDRIAIQGTSGTISAVMTDPGEATHTCTLAGG